MQFAPFRAKGFLLASGCAAAAAALLAVAFVATAPPGPSPSGSDDRAEAALPAMRACAEDARRSLAAAAGRAMELARGIAGAPGLPEALAAADADAVHAAVALAAAHADIDAAAVLAHDGTTLFETADWGGTGSGIEFAWPVPPPGGMPAEQARAFRGTVIVVLHAARLERIADGCERGGIDLVVATVDGVRLPGSAAPHPHALHHTHAPCKPAVTAPSMAEANPIWVWPRSRHVSWQCPSTLALNTVWLYLWFFAAAHIFFEFSTHIHISLLFRRHNNQQ